MAKQENTETKKNEVAIKQPDTPSVRFTNMVQREFSGKTGGIAELTDFQKRLIQNYFISVDIALKSAEEKRQKKAEKNRDKVPVTWEKVNMVNLSLDVVAQAKMGLDPSLSNHVNTIPFKNNNTGQYDIAFIVGYRGKELIAMKYGYNPPDDVIVEVVYSTDHFLPIKKDRENNVETYEFRIKNAFDRGEIIGGFYYHLYKDAPEQNRLVIMNLQEIEKRKPRYASAEFWGGERTVWKDGKPAGTEKVEGWYFEMVQKTIYRAAYGSITIDGQKVDSAMQRMLQSEREFNFEHDDQAFKAHQNQIGNANKTELDISDAEEVNDNAPFPGKQHEPEQAPEKTPEPEEKDKGKATAKAAQPNKQDNSDLTPGRMF